MNSRENFKQAARDLFGPNAATKERGADIHPAAETFAAELEKEAPVQTETAPAMSPDMGAFRAAEAEAYAPAPTPADSIPQRGPVSQDYSIINAHRDTSVIAKGTTIVGRIRTDGHIEVMGKVEGNIDAEGSVIVNGRVSGNIKGHNLELISAQVKGDLNAGAGAFVSNDTVVIGNISAENMVIDGRVKGNITATQSADFSRNTYLVGDITTRSISIETGAVINGMIRTLGVEYEQDEFDEFSSF